MQQHCSGVSSGATWFHAVSRSCCCPYASQPPAHQLIELKVLLLHLPLQDCMKRVLCQLGSVNLLPTENSANLLKISVQSRSAALYPDRQVGLRNAAEVQMQRLSAPSLEMGERLKGVCYSLSSHLSSLASNLQPILNSFQQAIETACCDLGFNCCHHLDHQLYLMD